MVIIVAITVLVALRYMILTRRTLCHPRSAFGRGLMVATGLFAALHFVNIATHVSRTRLCSIQVSECDLNHVKHCALCL